jgi:hypothetical protein
MKEQERAKEWARYAESACTEKGRMGALAAALHESPKVLELTLRELGLSSIPQLLEFCWKASKADNTWRSGTNKR